MFRSLSEMFKRKHPYMIASYIGRKNTQRIFDCKINKKSKFHDHSESHI